MTAASSRYMTQRYLLRKTGMTAGFVTPHLERRHIDWLATNKPADMTVAEFLVSGLLEDAMAEDVQ